MNKHSELVLVTLMALLYPITVFCQNDSLLKNGLTYASAYSPNQFKVEFLQIKQQPSYVNFVNQKAEYDTITIGLMAHAKTKEILTNIYEFEVIETPLTVLTGDVKIVDENSEFDIRHQIKENIATRWSLSSMALCDSPQNDCDLFEWVEVPVQCTQSKDNGKSIALDNLLETSVATLKIKIEGQEELIPVEYQFYMKIVETQSAKNEIIEVPAVYQTIPSKTPITSNLKKEWVEVMCPSKFNQYLISQIQLALKKNSCYKGDINGQWTLLTQAGLEYFQIKNELYVGQLDKNTLEKLGFNFDMLKHQKPIAAH